MRAAVVAAVSRPERLQDVVAGFSRQEYRDKRLVLVLNGPAGTADVPDAPGATVLRCEGGYPARARNHGLGWLREHAPFDAVAFMDDDDFYGAGWLTEIVESLAAGGGRRVVGKPVRYVRFDDGVYCCIGRQDSFLGGTMAGWVSTLPLVPDVKLGEDRLWCVQLKAAGFELVSLSGLHYLYNRRGGGHAWGATQIQALRCYGPAFALGDAPADVVDGTVSGEFFPRPTFDDVARELAEELRARPIEWPAEC